MAPNEYSYEKVKNIADLLLTKTSIKPTIGIICGSGLGGLADSLDERVAFDYKDIPDFPLSTVVGHAGRLVFGKLEGRSVVCMQGRFHCYEGYPMYKVTLPVRVMKLLGVEVIIITNAAGGLNPEYKVGDVMIMKDHIFFPNLAGNNPLVGPNDEMFGPRFPAMSDVYCRELRELGKKAAANLGMESFLREGVYTMLGGPSFETIAECKMLRMMGSDVVGMSTCPEVVVAAHCGIKVFGLSMVTNECVTDYEERRTANHEEVIEAGNKRAKDLQCYVREFVRLLPQVVNCH